MELLRDVFVWAYERSTQEYLALKQDLAEPDPMRLTYRDVIKQTAHGGNAPGRGCHAPYDPGSGCPGARAGARRCVVHHGG